MQHGLYLFTCEISSVNGIALVTVVIVYRLWLLLSFLQLVLRWLSPKQLLFSITIVISIAIIPFPSPNLHGSCCYHYCQDWEIDQPLQFCMHNFIFLIFAQVFMYGKYSTKICPSSNDQLYF